MWAPPVAGRGDGCAGWPVAIRPFWRWPSWSLSGWSSGHGGTLADGWLLTIKEAVSVGIVLLLLLIQHAQRQAARYEAEGGPPCARPPLNRLAATIRTATTSMTISTTATGSIGRIATAAA